MTSVKSELIRVLNHVFGVYCSMVAKALFLSVVALLTCLDMAGQPSYLNDYKKYEDGTHFWYYPTGGVLHQFHTINGKPDGEALFFHRNGGIESRLFYLQGKLDGIHVMYSKRGDTTSIDLYSSDTLTQHTQVGYYRNGRLKLKFIFYFVDTNNINPFLQHKQVRSQEFVYEWKAYLDTRFSLSQFQEFYRNGQLKYNGMGRKTVFHGPYKAYYRNGTVKVSGNCANDKFDGEVYRFNRKGEIRRVEHYFGGRKIKGTP
jgi:hypothetical protein